MKVTVRAFGPILEIIGRIQEVDLASDSTLDDLAKKLEIDAKFKNLEIQKILSSNMTILVNGVDSKTLKSLVLTEGARVDILSPFGGG
ncbi:MoaD/ThiS family protein [Candidatus Bathyarchaeota archaeon]|nr:MoaD/ThiS family protein [Candidatus Bathyarchaeota archaeon]